MIPYTELDVVSGGEGLVAGMRLGYDGGHDENSH
jgi:hypothetical protein